jgi:hypothetical protein
MKLKNIERPSNSEITRNNVKLKSYEAVAYNGWANDM